MERATGDPAVVIALIHGPVAGLPSFASEGIRRVSGGINAVCNNRGSISCAHGTFIASILVAKRGSLAPGICPGCTLLLRPVFAESRGAGDHGPTATPPELAAAINDCVEAGARVINLSLGLAQPSSNGDSGLRQALNYAAARGTLVVAAAGNQGVLGSSAITRHPWPIPVAACDSQARPLPLSNLAHSIGRRGLSAPGEQVQGIDAEGSPAMRSGTSVATPFVTGAIALLWSAFSSASAAEIRFAVTRSYSRGPGLIVPSLLDAWESYHFMTASARRSKTA